MNRGGDTIDAGLLHLITALLLCAPIALGKTRIVDMIDEPEPDDVYQLELLYRLSYDARHYGQH